MNNYELRLIRCGYTPQRAEETYKDIMKNFSIAELEVFVKYIEEVSNVDLLQP